MIFIASNVPTASASFPSACMTFPTASFPHMGALPEDENEPGPTQAGASTPTEPVPNDKWGAVDFFATRAAKCVEIEREIMNAFDRRQSLARRLKDAAVRRDDTLASTSAQSWLQTEAKLHELFARYEPVMREREATLRQLAGMR